MELQISEKYLFPEEQTVNLKERRAKSTVNKKNYNYLIDDLIVERGPEVIKYLEKFNLIQALNFIILSSKRHYFYDTEELKKIKTVINLNLLNQTSQISYCLKTLNYVIPLNGNLVGCFLDYGNLKKKKLRKQPPFFDFTNSMTYSFYQILFRLVPVYNWIFYIVNRRKIKYLTANEAGKLLKKNGFQIIDVTEINGLTYFVSTKVSHKS